MATATDIANLALDLLGEAPIADLDGTGSVPGVLERNRESVWREAQASFPWPALLRQDEVEAEDSLDGYSRYAVPDDCLRVLGVEGPYGPLEYRLENGFILCPAAQGVRVHYLAYCEDPDAWGVQLTRAIVIQWAIRVCFALTQNPNIKQALLQEYQAIVRPETRRLASYGGQSVGQRKQQGRWYRARFR
ncbi:MAG: hypothetical protein WC992_04015 [Acholeplasmataceae bacterium]